MAAAARNRYRAAVIPITGAAAEPSLRISERMTSDDLVFTAAASR